MSQSEAAAAAYGSLDNDALCIDADLIFDEVAEASDPDLGTAEGEALLLGVSRYA